MLNLDSSNIYFLTNGIVFLGHPVDLDEHFPATAITSLYSTKKHYSPCCTCMFFFFLVAWLYKCVESYHPADISIINMSSQSLHVG